jgi:two-component system cell cycle sensor histidine kinase/response regulator CckA
MFFGVKLTSQILNFVYSFFPIATLVYLAYKIWEKKRIPAGFPQLFFALLLTFIAPFQTFLLVLFFEYLYDYEASIATIVFWGGLVFALWGTKKIAENISTDLEKEIKRVIKFVVFISVVLAIVYYVPIYFKLQRTFIWKIGALFYIFSNTALWGLFTSISYIANLVEKLRNKSKILRVSSFYLLIEPLIYLTLVSFEVLPSWLFNARLVMSFISVLLAIFIASFTLNLSTKHIPKIISGVETFYTGEIKLKSLRKLRSLALTSIPFIAVLLTLQAILIKNYIKYEVERYALEKSKLLKTLANSIEFSLENNFKILQELSDDKDVIEINIPSLQSKFARAFQRFPSYIGNVSRVDEKGILRYTFPPDPKAIGRDISYQAHIKKFLIERKPFASQVFRAVQGYDAIALGYPVFDSKGNFKGNVSCLIDVKKMLEHFANLAGEGLDQFYVLSLNNETTLFSNDLNSIGQNFFEVANKFVRADVKDELLSSFRSETSGGRAIEGRHKWLRKINFAFSFAKVELLENDTETWAFVNLVDELTLLQRTFYHLQLYYVLFIASILIFLYLFITNINSIRHTFNLEEEINKQAEEIIQSERKYRELAENPLVGLAIYDENGFIFVNRRLCEMFGYEPDEFMKLTPNDIIHPEDKEKWIQRAINLLRGGYAPEKATYRAITKNGDVLYLTCYSKRVIHQRKPVVQTVIFDSTKEKLQEDMIKHLQRVESIGTFTMGMAHDFNNILQIIIASAQMIDFKVSRGNIKPEELKKYIDNIISISNRGAELIKRLKIFTRREVPGAEVLDFDQTIAGMMDIFKTLLPEFIEVDLKLNAGGSKIFASRTEIQQALLNIVVNSKDAIIEKRKKGLLNSQGKIIIETRIREISTEEAEVFKVKPGKFACVRVIDNGIGMDEKTKVRVFEPFFTTKQPEIGTGLGMPTVFGIVVSHGGFITIDSKLGEGTSVEICLPIYEKEASQLETEKIKVEKQKENIMLISENRELKNEVRRVLEKIGFDVIFADDRVSAFKILSENSDKISFVLIDSKTPRLHLREVIAELKIVKPGIKIVLLYSTPESVGLENIEVIENPDELVKVFSSIKPTS